MNTVVEDFTKVVRIGQHPASVYGRPVNIFCKIEYKDGKLSITGVEGPMSNGDARGSCGQIVMNLHGHESKIIPAPGWSTSLIQQFLAIWEEWHLNDMRAYDTEMKAAGWPELAKIPMREYKYLLNTDVWTRQRKIKEHALEQLDKGATAQYSPEEQAIANLPVGITITEYADRPEPATPEHYERSKHIGGHNSGDVEGPEHKTLGWVRPSDHPDGLLGRKLHPEGKGYGSAWFFEPVPEAVLAFLKALPDTGVQPAWV